METIYYVDDTLLFMCLLKTTSEQIGPEILALTASAPGNPKTRFKGQSNEHRTISASQSHNELFLPGCDALFPNDTFGTIDRRGDIIYQKHCGQRGKEKS